MKLLSPTPQKRVNELIGLLLLSLGLVVLLCLTSYRFQDPSWSTAAAVRPANLIGYPGAFFADLLLQGFGVGAFLFPVFLFALAWKWIRSQELEAGAFRLVGTVLLLLSLTAVVSFAPRLMLFSGAISLGGVLGQVMANYLMHALNPVGAILLTITALIVSVYLVSTFTMSKLGAWLTPPLNYLRSLRQAWHAWLEKSRRLQVEKALLRAEKRRRAHGAARPAPAPAAEPAAMESTAPPFDVVEARCLASRKKSPFALSTNPWCGSRTWPRLYPRPCPFPDLCWSRRIVRGCPAPPRTACPSPLCSTKARAAAPTTSRS